MATDPGALVGAPLAAPVADPTPQPQPAPVAVTPVTAPAPVIPTPAPAPVVAETVVPAVVSPVVTVDSSALRGQLVAAATGLVRIAGVFLVAHGALTDQQSSSIEPVVVQLVVGTALAVAGQLVAQAREWLSHHKTLSAAFTDPAKIIVK